MLNINNKNTEKVVAEAIVLGLYQKNLLTKSEYMSISKELKTSPKLIDNITQKSDIYGRKE